MRARAVAILLLFEMAGAPYAAAEGWAASLIGLRQPQELAQWRGARAADEQKRAQCQRQIRLRRVPQACYSLPNLDTEKLDRVCDRAELRNLDRASLETIIKSMRAGSRCRARLAQRLEILNYQARGASQD